MADHQCNGKFEHEMHEKYKTLWSGSAKTRQFLIPDAQHLPPGDFLLRTATGRERWVALDALAPFEVGDEEAQAWAKAHLGEVTRRLGAGLREALFGSADARGSAGAVGKGNEADGQSSQTPGLDLLADITGTRRERLSGDYRAVGQALRDYLKDMTGTAGEALSGDPQREHAVRLCMRDWAQTLRAHGIAATEVEDPDAASRNQEEAQDRDTPGGEVDPSNDGGQDRKS